MSALELRALLVDAAQCGAYFVDVGDRDALVQAATELDLALAPIDFAGCSDKHQVMMRFAQALNFPDWFGNNWDALSDCLADLSWWPADGYLLLLDNVDELRSADAPEFATLLAILNDVAQQWSVQRIPFWALMPLSTEALAAID